MNPISTGLLAVLLFVFALAGTGCDPGTPTITVWHASGGDVDRILQDIGETHEKETGTPVQVRAFDEASTLRDSLSAKRTTPDIFIGSHLWTDELQETGIADAYCLPDQCEVCQGSNPPEWCKYAQGNFSHGRIGSMAVGNALCTPDQCPACFGENPPEICKVMSRSPAIQPNPELQPDLLQLSLSRIYQDDIFPLGIPIHWSFPVIGINPDILGSGNRPASLDEVRTLAREQPGKVYVDPSLDGEPMPAPLSKQGNDPAPRDSFASAPTHAGALVTQPHRIPILQKKISAYEVLSLSSYRPGIHVIGGYVHAKTDAKEEALNVMYRIADEAAQSRITEATGQLPAHSEILKQAGERMPGGVVKQGTQGVPLLKARR